MNSSDAILHTAPHSREKIVGVGRNVCFDGQYYRVVVVYFDRALPAGRQVHVSSMWPDAYTTEAAAVEASKY